MITPTTIQGNNADETQDAIAPEVKLIDHLSRNKTSFYLGVGPFGGLTFRTDRTMKALDGSIHHMHPEASVALALNELLVESVPVRMMVAWLAPPAVQPDVAIPQSWRQIPNLYVHWLMGHDPRFDHSMCDAYFAKTHLDRMHGSNALGRSLIEVDDDVLCVSLQYHEAVEDVKTVTFRATCAPVILYIDPAGTYLGYTDRMVTDDHQSTWQRVEATGSLMSSGKTLALYLMNMFLGNYDRNDRCTFGQVFRPIFEAAREMIDDTEQTRVMKALYAGQGMIYEASDTVT